MSVTISEGFIAGLRLRNFKKLACCSRESGSRAEVISHSRGFWEVPESGYRGARHQAATDTVSAHVGGTAWWGEFEMARNSWKMTSTRSTRSVTRSLRCNLLTWLRTVCSEI